MIHKIYSGKYNFWGVLNGSSKLLNISSTNNFFPYCIINIHFALKTEKPPLPSETPSYGLVIYLLFFFLHFAMVLCGKLGTKYSGVDQIKFVKDSL